MPIPKAKGVLVKPRRAWSLQTAAGAVLLQSGVAGQFNYAALYNDSVPSVDIAVYGLSLFQSAANVGVDVRALGGVLPGATLWTKGNPLTAGAAQPPGSLYALQSASVFGTVILELSGVGGYFFDFEDSPFIIIPPNYSLVLKTQNQNVTSVLSALWAVY